MFTGIVQKKLAVENCNIQVGLVRFSLSLDGELSENLTMGASIAINGVCLTVTSIDHDESVGRAVVNFDVMQQTLNLSNLSMLADGLVVNVERSMTFGKEVGGHIVSGHIDCTATVKSVIHNENNCTMIFSYPEALSKYLLNKGFVALNGCSLTIADIDQGSSELTVCFIPETLSSTVFGNIEKGDKVNLELDRQTQAIVDTVERVLSQRQIKL